jgi:hypothetical protein
MFKLFVAIVLKYHVTKKYVHMLVTRYGILNLLGALSK